MKCDQVTVLLEDYLGGNLSGADRASVAEHLKQCASCSEELQFLKKYRKELGSYPTLTAPGDFLENIHRRIDAEKKGGIVRALFFPARIKIPLEAAALLALALTGILIFKPFRPEYVAVERPEGAVTKTGESKEKAGHPHRAGRQTAVARNNEQQREHDLDRQSGKGMKVASGDGTTMADTSLERKSSKADEEAAPGSQDLITLNLRRNTPAGPEEHSDNAIMAEKTETESAAESRSMQAGRKKESAAPLDLKKGITLPVERAGIDDIEGLARSLGGRLVRKETYRSAVVEIPAKNYPRFLKGLRGRWSVQNQYPAAVPTRLEKIQIKVNLAD